ncbi:MAG TPA: serpin family protein, partial [Kiritimatiellia bacterium]
MRGNTSFALDLYGKLSHEEGNLFFSPYSVSTALAMTYAGARGYTAEAMADTLHFDSNQGRLHPGFAELANQLKAIEVAGHVRLAMANSLWPQSGYDFLPEYLALVKTHYDSTITPVDYKGATEAARVTINDWVEDKTQDKIRDILQPGMLNDLTRL